MKFNCIKRLFGIVTVMFYIIIATNHRQRFQDKETGLFGNRFFEKKAGKERNHHKQQEDFPTSFRVGLPVKRLQAIEKHLQTLVQVLPEASDWISHRFDAAFSLIFKLFGSRNVPAAEDKSRPSGSGWLPWAGTGMSAGGQTPR